MDDDNQPNDDSRTGDESADPERAARRARDGELVLAVRAGDETAFATLFEEWFDRVHDVVRRIVRRPDVADEVAQDAFLSAWRRLDSLDQPEAFGGWLLRIARNAALNRHEREARSSAVDEEQLAMIEAAGGSPAGAPSGFAAEDRLGRAASPSVAVEDAEIVDLVWEAAEALPTRDVEVLDLQLRHGLSPAEIGELLDMNRNAANQLVHRLKGRLETAIRARVVWRGGRPLCADLASALDARGLTRFTAEAAREIEKHLRACTGCDERQRLRLEPSALFAAVPIVAVPMVVRQQAAAALIAHGVPLSGAAGGAAGAAAGVAGSGGSSGASGAAGGAGPVNGAGAEPWGAGGDRSHVPFTSDASPVLAETEPPPPPPEPEPAAAPPPPSPDAGDSRFARRLVGAGAVGLVAILLSLLLLRPVFAGGNEAVEAGLPSVTAATPTVLGSGADPSATVPSSDSTTSPTSRAGSGAETTAPSGDATTSTPRSTAPALTIDPEISIKPATAPRRWLVTATPARAAAVSPTLAWNADPDKRATVKLTVQVKGPGLTSADATGTKVICPGTLAQTVCTAEPGVYTYAIVVTTDDGTPVGRKTATLTVADGKTTTTATTLILR